MKIATYNVRVDTDYDKEWQWQFRKDYVMRLVSYHNWDLLALQEVRPNQVTDFKELADYELIAAERDGDGRGEGLAILYKKHLFVLLEQGHFWLSETPEKPSKHPEAGYIRIALWGIFKDTITQQSFLVINTHLDSESPEARLAGMQVINRQLDHVMTIYPTIFMGDLNAEKQEALHELLAERFIDAKVESCFGHYGPKGSYQNFNYHIAWEALEEIDYVYTKGWQVQKTGTLVDSCDRRYPSDHFPLEVELVLKER